MSKFSLYSLALTFVTRCLKSFHSNNIWLSVPISASCSRSWPVKNLLRTVILLKTVCILILATHMERLCWDIQEYLDF